MPTILERRARLLADIRAFFVARDVLEVDTPALSTAAVTDPNLHSFSTRYSGPGVNHGQTFYFHTSPEFAMKRLLAAGSGDIYQLAKVFRDGEAGRLHNPEFTLLEWYRLSFDHHELMDEVAVLVGEILALHTVEKLSYQAVFQQHVGLDPLAASIIELSDCVSAQGIVTPFGMPEDNPDPWLDLLLSHCIEPKLGQSRLTFIYDYPTSQAALARIRPGDPPVAERFELYVRGIELANGFHELNDGVEQRRRFEADNGARAANGLPIMPLDEEFLAIVDKLPPCAGVALGVDRLLMLAAGKSSIADVLSFEFTNN